MILKGTCHDGALCPPPRVVTYLPEPVWNRVKKHGTVKLLLGLPYKHHYGPRIRTTGERLSDLVAIHTPLCSGISVPLKNYPKSSQSTLNVGNGAFEVDDHGEIICVKNQSNQIYPDISQFMSLDLLGIKDSPEDKNHQLCQWNDEIKFGLL